MPAALPLAPYTVLDLTIARAGPVAVRTLADWGADVIRIDTPPDSGAGTSFGRRHGADEQNLHRNKRSLCLDLKSAGGAQVFQRLVARADIVVENFRAEVKQRLGLTYEQLRAVNPHIILGSISGFGQSGPYAARPGVDQIVQGLSGLMSVTGEPGRGPMRVGVAISDTSAGMFLAQGLLLALLHRERTGEGQWVHTSLLEAMLNKLDFQGARYTVAGEVPAQEGNSHPNLVPQGVYPAADGLVNIAASTQKMFGNLCKALGAEDLAQDPRYADGKARLQHRQALDADIAAHSRRFTAADLVARLNPVGVPCGPIHTIADGFRNEQSQHLRMTRPAHHAQLGTVQLVRSPINLSAFEHPEAFHHAAPDAGEHTDELLAELGFDAAAIAELRRQGAAS